MTFMSRSRSQEIHVVFLCSIGLLVSTVLGRTVQQFSSGQLLNVDHQASPYADLICSAIGKCHQQQSRDNVVTSSKHLVSSFSTSITQPPHTKSSQLPEIADVSSLYEFLGPKDFHFQTYHQPLSSSSLSPALLAPASLAPSPLLPSFQRPIENVATQLSGSEFRTVAQQQIGKSKVRGSRSSTSVKQSPKKVSAAAAKQRSASHHKSAPSTQRDKNHPNTRLKSKTKSTSTNEKVKYSKHNNKETAAYTRGKNSAKSKFKTTKPSESRKFVSDLTEKFAKVEKSAGLSLRELREAVVQLDGSLTGHTEGRLLPRVTLPLDLASHRHLMTPFIQTSSGRLTLHTLSPNYHYPKPVVNSNKKPASIGQKRKVKVSLSSRSHKPSPNYESRSKGTAARSSKTKSAEFGASSASFGQSDELDYVTDDDSANESEAREDSDDGGTSISGSSIGHSEDALKSNEQYQEEQGREGDSDEDAFGAADYDDDGKSAEMSDNMNDSSDEDFVDNVEEGDSRSGSSGELGGNNLSEGDDETLDEMEEFL